MHTETCLFLEKTLLYYLNGMTCVARMKQA